VRKYVLISVLLLLVLTVGTALSKKLSRRKMTGQFYFVSSNLFDGTVIVARDRSLSKLQNITNDHPIAGRLKFKRGKQRMIFRWPDGEFDGQIISENLITGVYDYVSPSNTFHIAPGIMTRIPMESNIIFHVEILRTKKRQMRGVVFYNYGKDVKKNDYRVVIYPHANGESFLKRTAKLKRLGFFRSNLPSEYEKVEAYVVLKDYVDNLPELTTNFPALTVDGTNVLSRDWRPQGFQIPKDYP
jgi:hypothetical protein